MAPLWGRMTDTDADVDADVDAATDADRDAGADDGEGKPAWWRANERLREEMALPPYRPSRFADDTYTHAVVAPLEAEHGCTIRFVGYRTEYPEDWAVWIDGDPAFPVGRHRDENGNTVYELSAEEFERRVEAAVGNR